MSLNTTTLGELLKRVYDKGAIQDLENLSSPLLAKVGDATDVMLGGAGLYFPVNVEGDNSFGYIQEGGAMPAANNEVVKQAYTTPITFIGACRITGMGRAISQQNDHAFAAGFQFNIDQKLKRMAAYKEGVLFRDGTGQLALINETTVPATTTAVDIDTPGAQWLEINDNVDIFNTSNVTAVSSAKVTDVDRINDQIKLDTDVSSSLGNNYKIYKSGLQTSGSQSTREPSGLLAAVATSGTYLGLSRTSYRHWQGNVIDAGSVDLTEDLLFRAENHLQIVGGHDTTGGMAVILHPDQRRKYLALTLAQKQFTTLNLDAGYNTLSFNGMPFVVSHKCQPDTVWVGDVNTLQWARPPGGEMQIDSEFGGTAIKWAVGFDAAVTYFREYSNLIVRKPNSWVRLHTLAKPTR